MKTDSFFVGDPVLPVPGPLGAKWLLSPVRFSTLYIYPRDTLSIHIQPGQDILNMFSRIQ